MKKIIYFIVTALAVLGMASCYKNQSLSASSDSSSVSMDGGNVQNNPKASEEDKAFSKNYGEGMGKSISYGMVQYPNEKLDIDAFIKGLSNVLAADTTSAAQSYLIGLSYGEEAFTALANIEKMYNIHIDKEAFYAAAEKALKGPKPTEKQLEENATELRKIFSSYQMGGPMGMGPGNQQGQMPQQAAPQQSQPAPQQAAPQLGGQATGPQAPAKK